MTVRPCVFDANDPTGGSDVRLIRELLAITVLPPNEGVDSVGALLTGSRQIAFIDTEQGTICRIVPNEASRRVPIPWWLWDGQGDFATKLFPVMQAALLEAFERHGRRACSWRAFGDFPGAGATPEEQLADSMVRANATRTALSTAGIFVVGSPVNPNLTRVQATVARLLSVVSPSPGRS